MKRCSKCGIEKTLEHFCKSAGHAGGLNPWCKECHNERQKERRVALGIVVYRKVADADGLRECSKCHERKPVTEFYKDKRAHDGLKHQCKACHIAGCADWPKRNLDKKRASVRKSHAKHREKYRAYDKEHKKLEHVKRRMREHRRKWAAAHPERMRELMGPARKRWRLNNPEAVLAHYHKRRARKRSAAGSFTPMEISALYQEQGGRCAHPWCRVDLETKFHRDHKVPLARGGSNFIENIQLLCALCNTKKGTKTAEEFNVLNGYSGGALWLALIRTD